MPLGTQTTCWYFQPVAKMTNSVTVAIISNGRVRKEIRFPASRCHGEKFVFGGVGNPFESSGFGELAFFIFESLS